MTCEQSAQKQAEMPETENDKVAAEIAEMSDEQFAENLSGLMPARDGAPDGHTWYNPPPLNLIGMTAHRDYWEERCEAAEAYIEASPCDPDITPAQIEAFENWQNSK